MTYDVNHNGVLEKGEVLKAFTASGYDSEEIEDLFDMADTDNSGELSFDEFAEVLKSAYI